MHASQPVPPKGRLCYSSGMETKTTLKDVLITIGAVFLCIVVFTTLGRQIRALIPNSFTAFFASELLLALEALFCTVVLRKTALFQSDPKAFQSGWLSAVPLFLILCLQLYVVLMTATAITVTPIELLLFFGHVFLVGFAEEVLFRGLIQRTLHAFFGERTRRQVLYAIFLAGVIFGSTHLINAMATRVNPGAVFRQALVTSFIGMYFGAVYFRTGKNIWYLIVLHALYDMNGMLMQGRLSGASIEDILSASRDMSPRVVAGWCIALLAVTLFVLRPKKMDPLLAKTDSSDVS